MVYGIVLLICHDHLFLYIHMRAVWVFLWNLDIPRYTASGGHQVTVHIGWSFFLRNKLVVVLILTPRISQPLMASTIFKHFRHKKIHLASTTFTLPYYTTTPTNAESHENRRSNPWDYTPTKTHIHTIMNKSLFPENQCKSSFHKFTTKSIKTYPSQYNKSMIHNLSNDTLTEDEFSVLTRSLSFVPTATKTFKQDINQSCNKFKTAC